MSYRITMSRVSLLVAQILLLTLVFTSQARADKYADALDLFSNSPELQPYFKNAYGYAIFPLIGKGGFIVGGAYGEGKVYERGSLTGKATMGQISLGLQAGGQAYREIIFFKDKRAYDEFTSGAFELDTTASAVAVTAGAHAKFGTTGQNTSASAGPKSGKHYSAFYVKGLAVFVHAVGGLMLEASVAGQRFEFKPLAGAKKQISKSRYVSPTTPQAAREVRNSAGEIIQSGNISQYPTSTSGTYDNNAAIIYQEGVPVESRTIIEETPVETLTYEPID